MQRIGCLFSASFINYQFWGSRMFSLLMGMNAPSFDSRMTVPLSRLMLLCHTPAGTLKPTQSSPGPAMNVSVSLPSLSYMHCFIFPRITATVSVVVLCRCIGTTVSGSKAFNIRWDVSAGEVRKSRFCLRRGFSFACLVKSSKSSLSNLMAVTIIDGHRWPELR